MHILNESVRSDAHRTITVRLRFGAPASSKLHNYTPQTRICGDPYCEQPAQLTNIEGIK